MGMTRFARTGLAVALLCAISGCSEDDRTEIVVVVDSDYDVPSEMDGVLIEVSGPGDETRSSEADLRDEPLPRTLGLVHRDGPLGPLRIRAAARRGGSPLVDRRAEVSFVEGETLMLRMDLLESCGVECPALSDEDLEPWPGQVPGDGDAGAGEDAGPTDGGPTDAGVDTGPPPDGCTPTAEVCNGVDDDCDGTADEGFDLETDPDNCGMCGRACSFANASATCSGGECAIDSCDADFGDCDGDPSNGCEASLQTDASNCGMCGMVCMNPARNCCAGTCERGGC